MLLLLLGFLGLRVVCEAFEPTVNHTDLQRRQCLYNPSTGRYDNCNGT